jgi:hypothetical protein
MSEIKTIEMFEIIGMIGGHIMRREVMNLGPTMVTCLVNGKLQRWKHMGNFYPTFSAAHSELLDRAERRIERHKAMLREAEFDLEKIRKLRGAV